MLLAKMHAEQTLLNTFMTSARAESVGEEKLNIHIYAPDIAAETS